MKNTKPIIYYSVLAFSSAMFPLSALCSNEIEAVPSHTNGVLVQVKGKKLVITAKNFQKSVATSASTNHEQAVVEPGGGVGQETISFNSGSEGNVIDVSYNISSHIDAEDNECLPNGKTVVYHVTVPKVEFAEVIRSADDPELPPSVPPTKGRQAEVTVTPTIPSGHNIVVEVDDGDDASNGNATITAPSGGTMTQSGTVTITGGSQTNPGKAGNLKLQAQLDGDSSKIVGKSKGFSVCAHPKTFQISYYADINIRNTNTGNALIVGLGVSETWDSDGSGGMTELDKCEVSEVVQNSSTADNPPFTYVGVVNMSGYGAANASFVDTHAYGASYIAAGPAGSLIRDQLEKFKCARCGATDQAVPNSGFKIEHTLSQSGIQWFHNTSKYGASITIGSLSTGAGNGTANSSNHNIP